MEGYKFCFELLKEAHIGIGGMTGSGKSVLLDDLIFTLSAHHPSQQRIVLIDPKRVGLRKWRKLPHVIDYATEMDDIIMALRRVEAEMDARYELMERLDQEQSNLAPIHVVIDEANEVLRNKTAEAIIDRLMRVARASNISLILATQDMSRQTGIPARFWKNMTCCIGLRCINQIDSRQIIGTRGCETLPQYGQAYILNSKGIRLATIPMTDRWEIDLRVHAWQTERRRSVR